MTIKTKNESYHFSFLESLNREERDPYQEKHFEQVLREIHHLERWMKQNNVENGWNLSEKLSFLRNAEANIRTGAAIRRTQLAWFALAVATIAGISGLLLAISSTS